MNRRRYSRCLLLVPLLITGAAAQSDSAQAVQPPVSYASVSQLNTLLSQLEQTSQTTQLDLAKLRIEKWKTDGNTKKQTQSNLESVQRNLQSALPTILNDLRNSPESLSAGFKLYRNLDALYDVFGSVVESAGAFGNKDEFQSLENDLNALENSRRSLGDRLTTLADSKEAELNRLRNQVRTLQASIPPPAAKKVIIDDTAPAKKPAPKKKAAVPKPPATAPQTPPTAPKQ
jgi:DNA repair exonuclease SbcCD ATPase subunit